MGRGAYFTFRYSSRVMRPSLSESYMWNRTGGGGEREGLGQPSREGARGPPASPTFLLGNLPQNQQETSIMNPKQQPQGSRAKAMGLDRPLPGG